MQKKISIGDILCQYGDRYINNNRISGQQKGLIHLLSACRTDGLRSHFESCDHCSYTGKSYDSCRDQHCPTCQQKDKLKWLDKCMK